MMQLIRKNTALRRLYYRLRLLRAQGQSNESHILSDLAKDAPRTFIEFGFHPIEFNCAAFARNVSWRGLLIDGSLRQVEDARAILPSHVEVAKSFLTLDNLDLIRSKFSQLGVLSIDVDGNDYWFLRALIDINPTLICVVQPIYISQHWARTIRTTELTHLRFHDLRHAHATHLLANGVHPKVASERLGHSKVGITLDLYSHVIPGMQEDAAAMVDTVLKSAMQKREQKANGSNPVAVRFDGTDGE